MPKTPTLKKLIAKLKLSYCNPAITDENFPYQKTSKGEAELLHFNKYISTEDVLKEIKEQGCRPATIHEGLAWAEKEWNRKDVVIFLGSVWRHPYGDRDVPYLSLWRGAGRRLRLGWCEGYWREDYRFLVFREGSKPLGNLVQEGEVTNLPLPSVLTINNVKYIRQDE